MMFIVLEGIDGSGKSTIAKMLADYLRERGKKVYLTEEPTKTWLGEAVRRGIEEEKNPYTQALLFFADRAEHVMEIKRKIEEGYVVISDRYVYSTYAYQGAQLYGILKLEDAMEWFNKVYEPMRLDPDVVFYIDIWPEEGISRIYGRRKKEKFERIEFLNRVREIYALLAMEYDFIRIDGMAPKEKVFNDILWHVKKLNIL